MIIRPPEAANSDFENSILAFLNDPKGVWVWSDYFGAHFKNLTGDMALYMQYKQNRIKSLAKRVKDTYPLSFRSEATPTDVLMQVQQSSSSSPDEPLMLAQVSPSSRTSPRKIQLKGTDKYADWGRPVPSHNTRNIILVIAIVLKVLLCCVLARFCVPSMVVGARHELNERAGNDLFEKNKILNKNVAH